jgi:hypothetical protein
MTRAAVAAVLALVLLGGVGCGKYGAPVRPPAPIVVDEGVIYDAGQPIEQGRERR